MTTHAINAIVPRETMIHFSKSKYTQGIQCPKMLWMRKNMPDQFDESVLNQAILETGNTVGDIAMGYFGPFVEVEFNPNDPDRFKLASEQTSQLLADGKRTICEATFSLPGHYCMVDILRVRDDGSFDIIEVKSSSSTKDIYFHDMAYQCWVVQQCGYDVHSVSLMHINTDYVRQGALDLNQLFTLEDHSNVVFDMVKMVPNHINAISSIAEEKSEPSVPIGMHCFDPYECGFRGWCLRELPENNVFTISNLRKKKAIALLSRGIGGFEDLIRDADAFSNLSDKQQVQVLTEINDAPPSLDIAALQGFLDSLTYPLYFLDFETFQEAIPSYDGQRPYEQTASQYSLHWVDSPNGNLNHIEFLAEAGTDPRRTVAERLCKDIPEDACVLAWNMGFEKGRIKGMASLFPDLHDHLMSIHANMRDLRVPFQQQSYYSKEMKGSSSIKKVLPALFPNDEELDYHALEGVHDGGEAANAFVNLTKLSPEEQAIVREQLLRYCELDTLAMVRIWERLREVVGER